MKTIDLSNHIERLEAFEHRAGIVLKSLSVFLSFDEDEEDNYVTIDIGGEVHASKGEDVDQDFDVIAVAYDKKDRVIGTATISFYAENFFAFDAFSDSIQVHTKEINKIRIYPKKA